MVEICPGSVCFAARLALKQPDRFRPTSDVAAVAAIVRLGSTRKVRAIARLRPTLFSQTALTTRHTGARLQSMQSRLAPRLFLPSALCAEPFSNDLGFLLQRIEEPRCRPWNGRAPGQKPDRWQSPVDAHGENHDGAPLGIVASRRVRQHGSIVELSTSARLVRIESTSILTAGRMIPAAANWASIAWRRGAVTGGRIHSKPPRSVQLTRRRRASGWWRAATTATGSS
jgi:hypothetical protein